MALKAMPERGKLPSIGAAAPRNQQPRNQQQWAAPARVAQLPIEKIVVDKELQPRILLDEWVAQEYAEALRGGASFPPLTVFWDADAKKYWLADGFHRYYAYRLLAASTVPVEIRQGTRRDALLYSCGANVTHGLRRSNGDKRRATARLLADPEWNVWSNRQIAKAAAVSHAYVDKMRRELSRNGDCPLSPTRLAKRGGLTYAYKRKAASSSRRLASAVRRPTAQPKPDAALAKPDAALAGADSGNSASSDPDPATLDIDQQNLTGALELIARIAEVREAKTFPVSEGMRVFLSTARDWLIALPG